MNEKLTPSPKIVTTHLIQPITDALGDVIRPAKLVGIDEEGNVYTWQESYIETRHPDKGMHVVPARWEKE